MQFTCEILGNGDGIELCINSRFDLRSVWDRLETRSQITRNRYIPKLLIEFEFSVRRIHVEACLT